MNDDYLKTRNIVQAYLNDELEDQVERCVNRIDREHRTTLLDWLCDHETTFCILIFTCIAVVAVSLIIIGCLVNHNLDIAKLKTQAEICKETGYGCVTNTKNTDIQFHDTPIIDVKLNEETK